jgi:hypothetical protein
MDEEEMEEDGGDSALRRWVVYSGSLDGSVKVWRVSDSGGGGVVPNLTISATTTPARSWRKGSSPSPLRSWTPYAATPEPKHMGAA